MLESVQEMLSQPLGDASGRLESKQQGSDADDQRSLRRFLSFYQGVRRDLTSEVISATRNLAAPVWPLRCIEADDAPGRGTRSG